MCVAVFPVPSALPLLPHSQWHGLMDEGWLGRLREAPGTGKKGEKATKMLQGLGYSCYGDRLGEQGVFRAISWFTGDGYTLMSVNEVLHSAWVAPAPCVGLDTQTGHHQTSKTGGVPSLQLPLPSAGARGRCLGSLGWPLFSPSHV